MKIIINYKASRIVWVIILYIAYAISITISLNNYTDHSIGSWTHFLTLVSFVTLGVQLVAYKAIGNSILSMEILMLAFMYVFYLGQTWLLSINYDFGSLAYQISYIRYGNIAYIKSSKYSMFCILYFYVGLLLSNIFLSDNSHGIEEYSSAHTRNVAKVLLLISVPVELYLFIIKVYTGLRTNYSEAVEAGSSSNLLGTLEGLFIPATILLLLSNIDDTGKSKKIYIVLVIYQLLYMFTGQRAFPVIAIIFYTYIYLMMGNKINVRELVKYILLAFLLLYILIVIRNSRGNGISIASLNPVINGNIIYDTISEFGITGRVVTSTIVNTNKPAMGMQILCGVLSIIPGWTKIFGTELINKYYTLYALDQLSWGSSFISDFYFDFGFVGGIVASEIYAFIVGRICTKFYTSIRELNRYRITLYSGILIQLLFSVRSYVFRLPRTIIWFLIIYYFVDSFVRKYEKGGVLSNEYFNNR